ncbi:MAG: Smr/MutS family protein [Flavobacteriales bacterium]
MKRLKLDLHPIAKDGERIEKALQNGIREAMEKKAKTLEIIPGKGSGKLKERVLKFLQKRSIKSLYHRVEKDRNNSGRLFVHFKH